MRIARITPEQVRAEQVRQWGEAKVRENELDVLRRFGRNAPVELRTRYADEWAAIEKDTRSR